MSNELRAAGGSPIDALLPKIVLVIFALQPLMDIASFWQDRLGQSNTATLLLRFGVLFIVGLLGFVLSRRKRVYIIAAVVCAALFAGHIYACHIKGYIDPVTDATNFVRVVQMPLFAVCFITFMKRNGECYDAIKKGLVLNFLIISAAVALSVATGTSRPTYNLSHLGILGWFSTSNAQSAIMSMLTPIVVWLAYESRRWWLMLAAVAASYAQLFYLGTRLAFLAIGVTTVGLTLVFLINKHVDWKKVVIMFVGLALCVGFVKAGPMYRNQQVYNHVMDWKQDDADVMMNNVLGDMGIDLNKVDWASLSDDEAIAILTPIYEFYSTDLCQRFGTENVIRADDFSHHVTDITNTRVHKITYCELLFREHPTVSRWFGMELERMLWCGENYDVENDFHGVYYLYGAVGLGLMIAFIAYFLALILVALKRDVTKYFTVEAGAFGISLCLALVNAYNTAGVLRRPNSSFYLSVLLAAVYFLVKMKKYPDEARELWVPFRFGRRRRA
jgi:hypothetical protein